MKRGIRYPLEQRIGADLRLEDRPEGFDRIGSLEPDRDFLLPACLALAIERHEIPLRIDDLGDTRLKFGKFVVVDHAEIDTLLDAVSNSLEESSAFRACLVIGDVVRDNQDYRHVNPDQPTVGSSMNAASLWACRYKCLRMLPLKSTNAPAVVRSIRFS